jgi:precorrin-6A/cobalt-precorrin-6A reductase
MILVMSGTKDGRELIQALSALGYDIIATTTTEYGGSLIEASKDILVIDHSLDIEGLCQTIEDKGVRILVDATHPYASGASENAMEAVRVSGIDYVRYERESLEEDYCNWFSTYEEMIVYLKGQQGNILLTIGANNLERFTKELPLERLYARVLPMSKIISKCEAYGLKPKNILGVQGPFSVNYNEAMIEAYDIAYMVSKATAKTGGFDQKIVAAKNKGIELLVLERPAINYTRAFTSIVEVVNYVEFFLKHVDSV